MSFFKREGNVFCFQAAFVSATVVDSVCEREKILKHWFAVKYGAFNSLAIICGATPNNVASLK